MNILKNNQAIFKNNPKVSVLTSHTDFYSYLQFIFQMIEYCPEVRPSHKEFQDFHTYVEYLEKTYSANYAMVKVIPPKGWKPRKGDYEQLNNMMIQGPIEQNTYGKGGAYECLHIQKKSMSVREYKKKINCFQQLTEGIEPEEVEKLFWKNISFSPPLYGADIKVTFMDESAGAWNLNSLKSLLSYGLKNPLPGVNTPYCYVGSWKTLFCWHTEDMELSAINFLHFGKPKFWYGVCNTDRHLLEKEAKNYFYQNYQKCPEYLRHKTYIINPYLIKSKYKDIKIHKSMQMPGEFMLVFSGGYHCGFNFGYNFAEAVNYATYSWLSAFPLAKHCTCRKDSVKVSPLELAETLIGTQIRDHKQVIKFCQKIKEQERKLELEQKLMQTSSTADKLMEEEQLKKILKKKLIKKKIKSDIKVKGEKYKIQTWAECEKCKKWRKIHFKIKKNQTFDCNQAGSQCYRRQQSNGEYLTLTPI